MKGNSMSANLCEQIEHWGCKQDKVSRKWIKQKKHRTERRRAKQNPQCDVRYRKYAGWEW